MVRPLTFLLLAGVASGQVPRIGIIEFYGLHKVPEAKIRQALQAREGDPLPPSKGDTEMRIDDVPGVVDSHLEAVCCDAGNSILYVGIEERGAPHFDLREPPDGDARLPDEITYDYRQFLQAWQGAVRMGEDRDDLTHGHILSANLETRTIQEKFIPLANDNLKELREVLRSSGDEEQRATAAYVIAYAEKKTDVVDDLQYALKDADAGVRANATRSLVAMAVLGRIGSNPALKISPTWFIEMLNSLSWSDRNQALAALQILTDNRDQSVLDQLRDRALSSLIEMARWKTLAHALPAYMLVGRIAGLTDQQIQDAWANGDRETVIAQATGSPVKKKR